MGKKDVRQNKVATKGDVEKLLEKIKKLNERMREIDKRTQITRRKLDELEERSL